MEQKKKKSILLVKVILGFLYQELKELVFSDERQGVVDDSTKYSDRIGIFR